MTDHDKRALAPRLSRAETKALRNRIKEALKNVEIPRPFNMRAFLDNLAESRQKPIYLWPQPPGTLPVCGIWISELDADHIYYEEGPSAVSTENIIMHEVSHMLLCHRGNGEELAHLFPHLDPDTVREALGRSKYSSRQEVEAEAGAGILWDLLGVDMVSPHSTVSPEDPNIEGRLAHALERARRG